MPLAERQSALAAIEAARLPDGWTAQPHRTWERYVVADGHVLNLSAMGGGSMGLVSIRGGAIAITAHHTDTQRAVDHVLAWMLS